MDLSLLARQSKPFSHLFANNQHRLFRKKILTMNDKHVAIHASLTIITFILVSLVLDDFANITLLTRMGLTISLIAMAFTPIMMTLSWFNLNAKLLLVLGSYAYIGFIFCKWQFQHTLQDLISFPVLIALLSLLAIRIVLTYLWKRQSIEIFMRAYG